MENGTEIQETARQSLRRCATSNGFLQSIIASSRRRSGSAVARTFAGLSDERIRELLRNSLFTLLLFSEDEEAWAPRRLLEMVFDIARNRKVGPEVLEGWNSDLLESLRIHDPDFDQQTASAWDQVCGAGCSL